MEKKEIFDLIDLKIRVKFRKQSDLAEHLGISRSSLNGFLKKIETGENFNFDTLKKVLEALDLELIIQEKK